MKLTKVVLLNPTTIRLFVDFRGTSQHFDVPLGQIAAMDAASFATWAQKNLVAPAPPVVPTWLKALENTTL